MLIHNMALECHLLNNVTKMLLDLYLKHVHQMLNIRVSIAPQRLILHSAVPRAISVISLQYYTITAWLECNMKIYLHEKIHIERGRSIALKQMQRLFYSMTTEHSKIN